jgi:type IV secretory pathway VirD2 relaxase
VSNDEREFRLRPQAPKVKKQGKPARAWSAAFKTVMHYARASRRLGAGAGTGGGTAGRPFRQRCAVRVTYSPNRISGQWRAHGKYIGREGATQKLQTAAGFNEASNAVDVAATLDGWQAAGDQRIFKVILSPEFGERVDLVRLTRELTTQMEIDLSKKLDWCGVAHFNTEHPHVHVAVRGMSGGEPLRFKPAYIKSGIREAAENLCTVQLGPRTQLDAVEAERREVTQQRFTSLDRIIGRACEAPGSALSAGSSFAFAPSAPSPDAPEFVRARQRHVVQRLIHLQKMGLAEPAGPKDWRVRRDFGAVLRAMQKAQDRQRLPHVHGALLSDERLPLVVTNLRRVPALDGRVLTHGEEDSGRQYMLLEGTDAKVHFIYHTPEVAAAWRNGALRPNAFVRFRRMFGADGRPFVEVAGLGDAEQLLKNKTHFRTLVRTESQQPAQPQPEPKWSGWLGKYHAAIANAQDTTTTRQRDPRKGRGR